MVDLLLDLMENRLYRNRQDSNKVVVVKEIKGDEVTLLHAPLMNSDIHWIVPPKRETLTVEDFTRQYQPFKFN